MSNEGRLGRKSTAALTDTLDPRWLLRHRFSVPRYVQEYRTLAGRAAAEKLVGLRALAPFALTYISDEKTLAAAWHHMESDGSHAPGPDGVRYETFTPAEVWNWCRAVRDTIRAGKYTLGDERVQRIPKGPGRGFRELVVQSIEDRVVHRAVVEILQPALDPLFDPRSFGYRPGKGPLRALATADVLFGRHRPGVWVACDVRNAFANVPVGRLLGVVRKFLPDDDLVDFIEAVTRPDKRPGLRQGSPLSPLLLNLYLHHHLDRAWRRLRPDIPLLRFADDILLMCQTLKQARSAYATLVALLRPAGFTLKEERDDAVLSVASGGVVKWMGFGIAAAAGGLRFTVTDEAWLALAERFADAHSKPHAPLAAIASLAGWVADKGPCFPFTDTRRAYARIRRFAAAQGFEEVPEEKEVRDYWQRSYARWCKLRKEVAAGT